MTNRDSVCTRLLAFFAHGTDVAGSKRVEFDARAAAIGLRSAAGTRYALATDASDSIAVEQRPQRLINVDSGKARGPRIARPAAVTDADGLLSTLKRDLEIFNCATLQPATLTLVSDTLGLKPLYLAELPDGTALANSVLDLLALWPELARPIDETALRELLMLGYPLQCRTLHARIRRTPPGVSLHWDGERLRMDMLDFTALAEPATADVDRAVARIGRALEASVGERLAGVDAWLGLTGGFDSRALLGAAQAAGCSVSAVTYGADRHAEVAVARAVARRAGVRHRVVAISTSNVRDALALNVGAVEATSRPIMSLASLLPAAPDPPVALMHGYLGDCLGGANLTKWAHGREFVDSRQTAAMLLRANAKWLPQFEAVYGIGEAARAMEDDLNEALAAFPAGHRGVVLWDLCERQRRLISGHFRILGERYDMCVPYYAPAVVSAYLSLPRPLLEGRALTRALIARRYCQLAAVRHDEEIWPLRANVAGSIDGLRLYAAQRVPALRRFAPHHEDIWAASAKQINASREDFVDAVEHAHGQLTALLPGVPAWQRERVQRLPAKVLAQLLQLSDYAAAVHGRVGGEAS